MSSTKKHQPSDAARKGASSPEARAKAVATRKRNMEQKKLLAESAMTGAVQELLLDAIPDREPAKKYARKEKATYMVTEKEWMFLKMAKMLLGEQ